MPFGDRLESVATDRHDGPLEPGGVEGEELAQFRHVTGRSRHRSEEQVLSSTSFVAHGARGSQRHVERHASTGVQLERGHQETVGELRS